MPTQQAPLSHAQLTDDGTPHAGRHADTPDGGEFAECDLSELRLVPVPDTGPPFDGELYGSAHPGASAYAGAPLGAPADGGASAGVQSKSGTDGAKPAGSRTEDEWSRQFALLLTETLAGARPLRQLMPWTTDRARGHLDKLRPLFSGGQRPRVQRVITNRPARDAIEMTVVVGVGARTRAIAVRLERARRPRQSRWPDETARPRLPAPTGQAAVTRPGTTARTAPQWLCTDIEAA